MKKILLFSSLCKEKSILEITIPTWINQVTQNFDFDILLYDDNKSDQSSKLVQQIVQENKNIHLMHDLFSNDSRYKNHAWTKQSIDRIIIIKNKAIQFAQEGDYDGLFLVDADLLLHPHTLTHLVSLEKDFVFEIFWTVFTDQIFAKPNCWDVHSWDYYNADSILKLKEPGTYKVGAGGACTLISKKALQNGLDFSRIKNMPYAGEDRHICTRAEVLGFDIFVDTHYPAYHLFKTQLIPEAQRWMNKNMSPDFFEDWLDDTWKEHVINYMTTFPIQKPKNKLEKIKLALYKAKRAYINYMRYN